MGVCAKCAGVMVGAGLDRGPIHHSSAFCANAQALPSILPLELLPKTLQLTVVPQTRLSFTTLTFSTPTSWHHSKGSLTQSCHAYTPSDFCITAGVERWCHKLAQFLAGTLIATIIHIYCFCVRHRHDTPMFRAFSGTLREASNHPRSIRFDTYYYWICIDTFASRYMSLNRGHIITYNVSEGR